MTNEQTPAVDAEHHKWCVAQNMLQFNLPKFAVLRWDDELEHWTLTATGATYEEAKERLVYWRGKGNENMVLFALQPMADFNTDFTE